jgi:CheY-like chemotaxis protein
MGASIGLESEVGKGSTFTIHFERQGTPGMATPLAQGLHAGPDGPSPDLVGGRPTILIVDDDPDARELLRNVVADAGYEPIVATGGRHGLELARTRHPDLITLDLMMPDLSGWEVLTALKADPSTAAIPVVVVSVVAAEQRGRLLGVIDLVPKPVEREHLVTVLRRIAAPGRRKALVIEDDPAERRLLTRFLADEAFDVVTAANGLEGLRRLEAAVPDLILLDLAMPVMDGVTFLATLRRSPTWAHIPVVIVTGEFRPDDAERLARETAGVVQKGVDFERSLRKVLERVRPAVAPTRGTGED